MVTGDEVINSVSPRSWSWIADHLSRWHYVSDEDTTWLTGRTIGRFVEEIQSKVRAYGYAGGDLSVHAFEMPDRGWLYLAYDTDVFDGPGDAERAYVNEEPRRWQHDVDLRVKDWLDRLRSLRADITAWLAQSAQSNFYVKSYDPVTMHEDLMRQYHVPAVKMDVFAILKGNRERALFRPKGLWTIGANGRVDVVTPTEAPILVDESDRLTRPSRWRIYPSNKRDGEDFTSKVLLDLVKDQ